MRVRLLVAYDGTPYSGMAPNEGAHTVGGVLADAIATVLRAPVELTMAGRTDRGVHAWGQVVTFDAPGAVDVAALQRSLNSMCGPSVVVREAAPVDDDFDARRSALARHYRYTVLNRPVGDPFLAHLAWHVAAPLDLAAMRLGVDPLIGEHDFSSFCRRPRPGPGTPPVSLVRRVLDAGWHDLGDGVLRFDISANAFCHQMVRSIVGALVDVGLGRRRASDVAAMVRARDRASVGTVAPPHGLCLWAVDY